jgi:hypothetical protein
MGNQNRIIFIPMRLKDILKESTEASDIVKDLDKVRTDLIKKVDVLISKKKKLYSDVDITTPMSADEKKLDKDIQDIFSQIQQIIQQKRKIKTESINELTHNEKSIRDGNPNNVYYAFYKGQFEAIYSAMGPSGLFDMYWDKFKVRRQAGSKFKLNPEFVLISKKDYDSSTSNRYAKLKPHVDKLWDTLKNESVNEAISPQVYREFMQACSDAGLNSFQIIGLHVLVYVLTLGATGATILSALGIAQLAKDAKDTFNNWNDGRKLNPEKVKTIVKDFENKVNKLEGGRKRFFQGIINKMKRANPEDKSSLVSINKDLKYYADIYNLDNESVNEGKYYIGYNKGRGQGTGVFKDVFPTYKDAKKELEKIEKQRGGSYNQIAYYVADEKGNFVREAMLGEGRGIKSIQNDLNKTIVAIQSEISSYKATKGTPQEKKHIDNLKKLHPIKKKLESELESAVSGLYKDAELKIED